MPCFDCSRDTSYSAQWLSVDRAGIPVGHHKRAGILHPRRRRPQPSDLTGLSCTSRRERLNTEKDWKDAQKEFYTRADRGQVAADRSAESQGKTVPLACKEGGITDQTYYRWRKEYGGLQLEQAKKLKDLQKENAQLKRALATLTLEKQVLKDIAEGNF